MRSKSEILQEWYGVKTAQEALEIFNVDCMADNGIPFSQWTKLKLPYEAPSHPGIPSLEDIKKGMKENYINRNVGTSPVCRVGQCVVKSGGKLVLQEGEDMIFLRQHSLVRVPDVYAIFEDSSSGWVVYYLIMEFIEGETLDYNMWKVIGDDAHDKICGRIAEQFSLLRSIPSEGYYGRVNNQGWEPGFLPFRTRYKELCGPYKTYEEFLSALNTGVEVQRSISNLGVDFRPEVPLWVDKLVPTLAASNGREPVFTHTDPALRNMIIRPLEGTMATARDYEVTLIDWAYSGWLPAWMQMVAFDKKLTMHDMDALRKGNYDFDENGRIIGIDKEPYKQLMAKIAHGLGNPSEEERKFFGDFGMQTDYCLF